MLKYNPKKFTRFGVAGVLVSASALLGFNCSGFGTADMAALTSVMSKTEETQVPVAVLSSEQLLKAMLSVTGTEGIEDNATAEDKLISSTYDERSGSLPSGQDLKLATGPMQISAANIASAVCAKAVDREREVAEDARERRLFFREMDFSKGLSAQNSNSVSMAFERLARNAWRRDVSDQEVDQIVEFAQEFSREASPTDVAQTRMLAISTCTAVLSSIDAITY